MRYFMISALSGLLIPCLHVSAAGNSYGSTASTAIGDMIFSIVITACIYSLPIIIYRYAIARHPVSPRKARRITIIYGIIGFLIMAALLIAVMGTAPGGSIVLWSFINYAILSSGYEEKNNEAKMNVEPAVLHHRENESPLQETAAPDTTSQPEVHTQPGKIAYCRRCGFKLIEGSAFCSRCGNEIEKESEI